MTEPVGPVIVAEREDVRSDGPRTGPERVVLAHAAAWTDLDVAVRGTRGGEPLNLRWILVHLVEEYARHLGHMDLLREALDGRTGC